MTGEDNEDDDTLAMQRHKIKKNQNEEEEELQMCHEMMVGGTLVTVLGFFIVCRKESKAKKKVLNEWRAVFWMISSNNRLVGPPSLFLVQTRLGKLKSCWCLVYIKSSAVGNNVFCKLQGGPFFWS
jgi:hypothetical protein